VLKKILAKAWQAYKTAIVKHAQRGDLLKPKALSVSRNTLVCIAGNPAMANTESEITAR